MTQPYSSSRISTAKLVFKATAAGFQVTNDTVIYSNNELARSTERHINQTCDLRKVQETPTFEGRFLRIPAAS